MKRLEGENLVVAVFGTVFLLSLIMIFSQGSSITGHVTVSNTTSNVTIQVYFAIDMSTNLSNGIEFGTISTLPVTSQNATDNHNGVNTTVGSPANSSTSMWMNVSTDSNADVDFCILATTLNTSSGDYIGLGNETYYNSSQTNHSLPAIGSETSITSSYVKAGPDVVAGNEVYYRFWLDVPAATPTGTYNNTVSFKGISAGGSC